MTRWHHATSSPLTWCNVAPGLFTCYMSQLTGAPLRWPPWSVIFRSWTNQHDLVGREAILAVNMKPALKVAAPSGPAHTHNSLLKLHKHKRCPRLSFTQVVDMFLSPLVLGETSVACWMFLVSPVTSVKAKQEPPPVTECSRSVHYDHSLNSCQSQPWVTVSRGGKSEMRRQKAEKKSLF